MESEQSFLNETVTFNRTICTSCGICSRVCMFSVIIMDENGMPVLSPRAPPCSRCGHCEAFCPQLAIRIFRPRGQTPSRELRKIPISIDQMKSLVMNRRSIRQY